MSRTFVGARLARVGVEEDAGVAGVRVEAAGVHSNEHVHAMSETSLAEEDSGVARSRDVVVGEDSGEVVALDADFLAGRGAEGN